jgi:dihydrofolate reductase
MRRLIVWNLVTLDGFFEGAKPWDLDWHNLVWGEELEQLSIAQLSIAQLKTAGALLFGRITYEGMAAYWAKEKGEVAGLMNRIPKVVFSRTLAKAEWNNTRLVKDNATAEAARLKREPGMDLFIFGSANLISGLLPAGLIDEYRLCLAPVILGNGKTLFKPGLARIHMKLIDAKTLKTGGVILRYQPVREG